MELELEQRLNQIELKIDLLMDLLAKKALGWQINEKAIIRMELEYWPNTAPDGAYDTPGFGLKLQQSGTKKVDTYKLLFGKDISEYDLKHFQELPVNSHLDFGWMNEQVADLKRKYKKHHISFFHQYYANNPGMEEVFNNFILVVDKESLSGFVVFRCINDKPISMEVEFQVKEMNGKTRYICVLAASQLRPIRAKIK